MWTGSARFTAGLAAVLLTGVSVCSGGRIWYVQAGVDSLTANGRSWQMALAGLADALTLAQPGDEIRVAKGRYGPLDPGGWYGGQAAVCLKTGVTVKGGYAGLGALDPDARDTAVYVSLLRGGVSGDGTDATAVLDGFKITGSGMRNIEGNPTVVGCWFEDNNNLAGGAVFNSSAAPTFIECVFRSNRATDDDQGGGAMYNSGSKPVLRGCRFADNFAEGNGGAIWNCVGSSPLLTNCIFEGNSSSGGGVGGAICNYPGSRPTLTNCTVVENRDGGCCGGSGSGGMYSSSQSGATVINCIFWHNTYYGTADEAAQIAGGDVAIHYSCIEGWTGGPGGMGNISIDPMFFRPGHWESAPVPGSLLWVDGDYHLKSQAGRWDAAEDRWVRDAVTSPCIDAGAAMSAIMYEPFPNGGLVNMGAYGGTAEASKSWFGGPVCERIVVGDLNGDCVVNLSDLALMAAHWLEDGRQLLAETISN